MLSQILDKLILIMAGKELLSGEPLRLRRMDGGGLLQQPSQRAHAERDLPIVSITRTEQVKLPR